MTDLIVAMENFVPLNQQQRESKKVIADEIQRLRAENDKFCEQACDAGNRLADTERKNKQQQELIAELEEEHGDMNVQNVADEKRIAELEQAIRSELAMAGDDEFVDLRKALKEG